MLIKINKSVHLTRVYIIIYSTSKRIAFFSHREKLFNYCNRLIIKIGMLYVLLKIFQPFNDFLFF